MPLVLTTVVDLVTPVDAASVNQYMSAAQALAGAGWNDALGDLNVEQLSDEMKAGRGGYASMDARLIELASPQFVVLAGADVLTNESVLAAGTGLSLVGATLSLPAPGTLTVSSPNAAAAPHTHAITASADPGATSALLKTDSGALTIQDLTVDGTLDVSGTIDSHLIATLSDACDLGSLTKFWRKGFISELDALVFAANTATLIGGYLIVGHGQGSLNAAAASGDTTMDFGMAMTENDWVVFRALGQVEYVKVLTVVAGTVYNVTRNLDGTGANDWPAGTPYLVLGHEGDPRLELVAISSDSPKLDLLLQGSAYNTNTIVGRFGNMRDAFGVGAHDYMGFGVGDYAAGNYLKYETNGGFVLKAGDGGVTVDSDGLSLIGSWGDQPNQIKWLTSGGSLYAKIDGDQGLASVLDLDVVQQGTEACMIRLTANDKTLNLGQGGVTTNADISFDGNLKSMKNSTGYDVYGFVPLAANLTSTSWDGDAYSTTAKTLIDLSAVFGVPAGVKAVYLYVTARDSGSLAGSAYALFAPDATAGTGIGVNCSGYHDDQLVNGNFIVPCDANGDIYYQIVATGAGTLDVWVRVWGYWI